MTLEQFLAQVEKKAFRMAQVATGNVDEALDIVQDAMMQLVKSYRDRDAEEWPALFHRIMQNRIRDWYRKKKVRSVMNWFSGGQDEDHDPVEDVADPQQLEPEADLIQKQFARQLEKALHELPIRQQQVFLLRNWEGLDVNQTAKALGISSGSVKTHYFRAVQSLKDKLGEHGYV